MIARGRHGGRARPFSCLFNVAASRSAQITTGEVSLGVGPVSRWTMPRIAAVKARAGSFTTTIRGRNGDGQCNNDREESPWPNPPRTSWPGCGRRSTASTTTLLRCFSNVSPSFVASVRVKSAAHVQQTGIALRPAREAEIIRRLAHCRGPDPAGGGLDPDVARAPGDDDPAANALQGRLPERPDLARGQGAGPRSFRRP